jgi:hypothetical protein
VVAGIFGCPFHNNTKTHYLQSNWVQSVQGYVSYINGSIIVWNKPTIQPLRENDIPIMSASTANFTRSDLQEINACRLFLQVTFLAEISCQSGKTFLQCAMKGTLDTFGKPMLWHISSSKLKWPNQSYPSSSAWNNGKNSFKDI